MKLTRRLKEIIKSEEHTDNVKTLLPKTDPKKTTRGERSIRVETVPVSSVVDSPSEQEAA